jgi:hypothetical protein
MFRMNNMVELTESLQIALKEAAEAEKKLANALKEIEPLQDDAESKRNAVQVAMAHYQNATGSEPTVKTRRGGAGGKRAPRSLTAVLMTSATRNLRELHKGGTQKRNAVNQVLDRARTIASERNEILTDEIEKLITGRAAEIWGAK